LPAGPAGAGHATSHIEVGQQDIQLNASQSFSTKCTVTVQSDFPKDTSPCIHAS